MKENRLKIVIEADNKSGPIINNIRTNVDGLGRSAAKSGQLLGGAFSRSNRGGTALLSTLSQFAPQVATLYGIYEAVHLISSEFTSGLAAVEDYNQSLITMSAFITTFSERTAEGDLAGAYKEATTYVQGLIPWLERLDAKTIATGRDLTNMTEVFIKNGVMVDMYNQRQEDGLVRIMNALMAVTKGQDKEVQIQQELTALLTGRIRPTERLGMLLSAIDPQIKSHVKLWKEEGVLVERVGDLLAGFDPAAKDLEHTWSAIGSSLETIHTQVLRGGMAPAYEDLIGMAESLKGQFIDQNGELTNMAVTVQNGLGKGWSVVANVTETAYNLTKPFLPLLNLGAELVGEMANGWGMIFAILPPISEHVGNLVTSTTKSVEMVLDYAMALWSLMSLNPDDARYWAQEAQRDFEAAGEAFNNAIDQAVPNLLAEMDAALAEYDRMAKKRRNEQHDKPPLPKLVDREDPDSVEKQAKQSAQVQKWLAQTEIQLIEDSFARKEALIEQQAAHQRQLAGEDLALLQEIELRKSQLLARVGAERSAAAQVEVEKRAELGQQEADDRVKLAQAETDKLIQLRLMALSKEERSLAKVRIEYEQYREELNRLHESGKVGLEEMVEIWARLDVQEQAAVDSLKDVKDELTLVQTVSGRLEDGFVQAFDNMSRGVSDFGDVAMDVIRSIFNEFIRASVAKPAAGFLGQLVGGLFNASITSGAGVAPASITDGFSVSNSLEASGFYNIDYFHSGGIVGRSGGGSKHAVMPSSLFANAPRFHNGLAADEFPAILQRGEEVIPKNQVGRSDQSGQPIYNIGGIHIHAMDAKSFADMAKRNPMAIIQPVIEGLQRGHQGLIGTLKAVRA